MVTHKFKTLFLISFLFNLNQVFAYDPYPRLQIMSQYMESARPDSLDYNTYDASFWVNGVQVDDACAKYVNSNGLGEYGQYAAGLLESGQFSHITSTKSLERYCPNYSYMDLEDRSLFWVLILTTMAHYESNCGQNQTNKGAPNGTAKGHFQLHLGQESGYDGAQNFCVRNASLDPKQSIRCALGMLNSQLAKTGKIFTDSSYWDVLRPSGVLLKGKHKYEYIKEGLQNSKACEIPLT